MKSLYLSIAFAIAIVAVGIAIMSASFPDASAEHAVGMLPTDAQTSTGTSEDRGAASVASLVGGLEDRLRTQPDDGKGWLLLAKSYRFLGRLDDAREAYKKADALGQGDAVVQDQLFGATITDATQSRNSN